MAADAGAEALPSTRSQDRRWTRAIRGGETGPSVQTKLQRDGFQTTASGAAPERVFVHEIITKPVLTPPSDLQVHLAIRLLTRFEASRAVVIGHDRNLVGLATLRDLVTGRAGYPASV